jgi:hypothetical protein
MSASSPASVRTPTVETVVDALPRPRLLDLSRVFGCAIRDAATTKERLIRELTKELGGRLAALLRELGRDELRAVSRRHGLPDAARARADLQTQLLVAAGLDPTTATVRPPAHHEDGLPPKGQVVHARQRQWMVDDAVPAGADESALVRLVCLDDDDPGRQLDVLWDLELGARVVAPETQGLGEVSRLDPPDHFGAYLHALKWSAVSAADATRFQAPFRAGIKLMAHQLTPLMKALELPRANLFIADDVGLGKTIEAGLVLQELILRQQADFVLVTCPASICLQWRDEMQRRFGLRFEVMTRQFVAYRRQERGFQTNPWATHNRFIISHALLRRPEYLNPLLDRLGHRARKGLLILDEAHVAAPASASKYAVDTEITRTIEALAPLFDNRLFLSATPHNGHSNSFSALLELLDPVRFNRGVPVQGRKDLEPIMVRRLKRDLRQLGVEKFPRRELVQLSLTNAGGEWTVEYAPYDAETGDHGPKASHNLGPGKPSELVLGEKLQRYTELCAPAKGQGRLPFIHLQQRLLSSPEAFAKTLEAHVQGLASKGGPKAAPVQRKLDLDEDPETHGVADEVTAQDDAARVRSASSDLPTPTEEARKLLDEMRAIAEKARREPDAKGMALLDWIRDRMCPAVGRPDDKRLSRSWTDTRVILFTEYADTKRYLVDLITQAISHTDDADRRIRTFHGGMGDDARDEVQRAFNAPPDKEPVRILVATDAAREGVNLQGHCADLFHIDIPWNPARMEQRNGRIDRTLQEADVVRCHYFLYPARTEDHVLEIVVKKVGVIQTQLGSLGAVLYGQLESALSDGIGRKTKAAIEKVGEDSKSETVEKELEEQSKDRALLEAEIHRAGRRLEASKRALKVEPDALRGVVDIGLRLAGAGPLAPSGVTRSGQGLYTLPALDRSWDKTLDTLRPRRERTEAFWQWRQRPPRPVTFHELVNLTEEAEQMHLAHPLVKRILDRFLAQGFGAHDLTRVTGIVAPDESVARVVAYARLTLFGSAAARLHDEIVAIAAPWPANGGPVEPYKDPVTAAKAVATAERLLATGGAAPNKKIAQKIQAKAPALFAGLWPSLHAEADALAAEARKGLIERGRREADELKRLLDRQTVALGEAEKRLRQMTLFQIDDKEQRRQIELDLDHVQRRREKMSDELASEPAAIEALYEIKMSRLTQVGLVVVWPEAMT